MRLPNLNLEGWFYGEEFIQKVEHPIQFWGTVFFTAAFFAAGYSVITWAIFWLMIHLNLGIGLTWSVSDKGSLSVAIVTFIILLFRMGGRKKIARLPPIY